MEEKFIMGNVATMSDPRESMKYKVGDEVLYAGKRWIVRGVVVAYMVDDASGELGGIHVAESMLRPANEAAQ